MKFSIIIPCYNQSEYLDECLQSVINQTYDQWECIIVNDGSSDKTEEIALEWTKKDGRFSYFLKLNGGLSSARNFGIRKSDGNYILPLDADDKISDNYLELALKIFEKDSEVKLVYGQAEFFEAKNEPWFLINFDYKKILLGNHIYCSNIYSRSLIEDNKIYDENMKDGFEDWEFLIRKLDGVKVIRVPETVFYYRIKENSMMQSLNANKIKKVNTKIYIYKKNIAKYKKHYGVLHHFILLKYKLLLKMHS